MSKAEPAYCRASAFAVGFRAKRIAKFHPFINFDFSVQAFWPAQMYFDVSISLRRRDNGNKVSEKQVIEELDQIQKQLMKKYGSGGVANEKLQDELREFGSKRDGYWDARKILEGALIYNRTRSEDPEKQKMVDEILGENLKVGPAVSGYGNQKGCSFTLNI